MNSQITLNSRLDACGFLISHNDFSISKKSQYLKSFLEFDLEKLIIEIIKIGPMDGRLFSLLFSWIKVHGNYVIIEKLDKLLELENFERNKNLYLLIGLAQYAVNEWKFHKWKTLFKHSNKSSNLISFHELESFVKLRGQDPNFKKAGINFPKGVIRIRERDILSAEKLAKLNQQFKNRLLFGVSWRADIITAIECGLNSPIMISKTIGCSYEPAHRIFREYSIATNKEIEAA